MAEEGTTQQGLAYIDDIEQVEERNKLELRLLKMQSDLMDTVNYYYPNTPERNKLYEVIPEFDLNRIQIVYIVLSGLILKDPNDEIVVENNKFVVEPEDIKQHLAATLAAGDKLGKYLSENAPNWEGRRMLSLETLETDLGMYGPACSFAKSLVLDQKVSVLENPTDVQSYLAYLQFQKQFILNRVDHLFNGERSKLSQRVEGLNVNRLGLSLLLLCIDRLRRSQDTNTFLREQLNEDLIDQTLRFLNEASDESIVNSNLVEWFIRLTDHPDFEGSILQQTIDVAKDFELSVDLEPQGSIRYWVQTKVRHAMSSEHLDSTEMALRMGGDLQVEIKYPDIKIELARDGDEEEIFELYKKISYKSGVPQDVKVRSERDGETEEVSVNDAIMGITWRPLDIEEAKELIHREGVLVARHNETGQIIGLISMRWPGRGIASHKALVKELKKGKEWDSKDQKFYFDSENFSNIGIIDEIGVDPRFQQRKIMKRLIIAAKEYLSAIGAENVITTIMQAPKSNDPSLRLLFGNLGWRHVATKRETREIDVVDGSRREVEFTHSVQAWDAAGRFDGEENSTPSFLTKGYASSRAKKQSAH